MTDLAVPDHVRMSVAWSENTAPGQVRACGSPEALVDWIIANRHQLADLERGSPTARATLQVVISNRFGEVGR